MKLPLLLLAAAALAGCQKPARPKPAAPAPLSGAQFKEGFGLTLTGTMQRAIGLKVVEVEECAVAPAFRVPLHADAVAGLRQAANSRTPEPVLASGWLNAAQAAAIQVGTEVELRPGGRGVVRRLEKAAHPALGDFEVTVECAAPVAPGARLEALFRGPAGEAITAVPRSALLQSAEGTFVYAVNDAFYVRTPVKIGAANEERVAILDGLYAGDQVVASPVQALWLAELQVLRGGKACTCGQ